MVIDVIRCEVMVHPRAHDDDDYYDDVALFNDDC